MAGEGDAERLVVLLEARIRDFEKNMAKASGTAGRSYAGMRRDSKRATDQMEQDMVRSTSRINQLLASTSTKIGSFGKAFVGGLVAGGVAGIVQQFSEIAEGIATIGDEAKRAGLSTKAFQELRFVAEQNRLGVDSLVDGIKELNLRADEFIRTGAGPAAEAFGRLGYDAETLKEKLKDPSALFTEIIGKLENLDKAAQIRIADEVFGGTGGEKFVQLIEQGERGIRDQIRAANDLGALMSDDVIAKADELDKRFKAVTTTISTGLKTAVVEVAAALAAFIDEYQSWATKYEERKNAVEAGADIGRLAGTPRPPGGIPPAPAPEAAPAVPDTPSSAELATKYLRDYRDELALTNRERAVAAETQNILNDAATRGITITREQADALAREKVARDEADAAGKKSTSERERQARATQAEREQVTQLIAELEEELSLVGASAEAKRAAAAAREAGAAATDEERRKIVRLNEAIHDANEADERRRNAIEDAGNAAIDGVSQLTSAIQTGSEALDQFLAKLIEVFLQAALLGTGPLGGLFGGGLLGGGGGGSFRQTGSWAAANAGFAVGTANTGGRPGEPRGVVHGQEAVIPLPSGGRVPVMIQGGDQPAGLTVLQPIINNSAADSTDAEVRHRRDANGIDYLEVLVTKKVEGAMASGKFDKTMAGRFGVRPTMRSKG